MEDYWEVASNERKYLDLRASSGNTTEAQKLERNNSKITLHIMLKNAATKKLTLRISVHSVGEYLYILSRSWVTLRHQSQRQRLVRIRGKQSVKKRFLVHRR